MKKDRVPNKHVSHTATVQGAGSEQSGDITSVSASTQQQFTRGDRAYVRQESPQERLKIVNDHKLCHNCLLGSHDTQFCGKRSVCLVKDCGKKHTMYLHIDEPSNTVINVNSSDGDVTEGVIHASISRRNATYMPIVPVKVNNSDETVFALLDTASSNTFCSRRLENKLGIAGKTETLNISTIADTISTESKLVQLDVSSLDGNCINMSGIFVIDKIPVKSPEVDVSMHDHLNDIEFSSLNGAEMVDLLIGQDHSEVLMPLEIRKGNMGEPFAIRSVLGWCLNGPAHTRRAGKKVVSNFISTNITHATTEVQTDVDKLWRIENEDMDNLGLSREDTFVQELWDEKTRQVDGHFELPIPWKDPSEFYPDNVKLAAARLQSLLRRLRRENRVNRYDEEIAKLVEKGYAEKVPAHEINESPGRTWYLPHHHVISDKKPDKVRVVFDCASRFQGKSLNDRVFQGPDLVNKLVNVLLRFRQHSYAIQADIEAMYHQVRVPLYDRDALRFLWMSGDKIEHYRMTCHLFGGKWCSSSSAYALRLTVQDAEAMHPIVKSAVENSFYVDDLLHSCADRDEARTVIHETPKVLLDGGFTLTKFVVNDKELVGEIDESHRAKEVRDWSPNVQGKVLGVKWNISSDTFGFEVNEIHDHTITRQRILSIVSSIFDPLGFLGPIILPGKLIFQEATRLSSAWDEEVPGDLRSEWLTWVGSLGDITSVTIPRCVKPGEFDKDTFTELHHFADAGVRAYGACSYIRCINKCGEVHTQLLISKNKVAPLKHVTIPRLELQAALLASKLDLMLRTEMDIEFDRSYFWSDSKIVLGYIKNEGSRFHVFVANRVTQIRDISDPDSWHYVASADNPADLLTRSKCMSVKDIKAKWFVGPSWLREYKCNWPSNADFDLTLTDADPEVKKSSVSHSINASRANDDLIFRICSYLSDWYRLQRAVAWLCRYVIHVSKQPCDVGGLKLHEIEHARNIMIKQTQRRMYSNEIDRLRADQNVLKSSSLRQLSPFIDDKGIMRVGGRTGEHPCIIPHEHPIARAIVLYYHNQAHVGAEWTLSLVRQTFWITKSRRLVKKIVRSCVTCRKLYGKTCAQKMADLPSERLQASQPPFTNVGIDIFGPISVKHHRSTVKRYGCIFTCMATRAIHVEMLNTLDADSFINGFRRFVARRGKPDKVVSDNGLNLVGGEREMRKARKELIPEVVKAYAVKQNIEWDFIPPAAPHMGGVWERMVGLVKRAMAAVIPNDSRLSDEVLQTLFCEIESIVNGRPLTKLSYDANDLTPLTPNHILLLKGGSTIPPGKFDSNDVFRRRWSHAQHLADAFWRRWTKLYVPELQKRVKWTDVSRNVSVGDLVMISDENTPRNVWPLALVKEITVRRDGLVRSVRLRTRATELVRPITKLVLLEAAAVG